MAGRFQIADTVLSAGQNEGFERAVLPLPQVSRAFNVRLRKTGRWGKRFGFHYLDETGLSVSPGYARGLGPGFAIRDDQCNRWDRTTNTWVPTTQIASGDPNRKACAVSGWQPERAFFPLPIRVSTMQTATPCDCCYSGGYIWTVKQTLNPANGIESILRVTAVNPDDQTLIFLQDLIAAGTSLLNPRLTLIGATLVLTYVRSGSLFCRTVTTAGFGVQTLISAGVIAAYDIAPYVGAVNLALVAFGIGTNGTIATLDNTLVTSVQATFAEGGLNISSISIAGNASLGVTWVGYGLNASSKVRAYDSSFTLIAVPLVLSSTDNARPLLAQLPNGYARIVYSAQERTLTGGLKIGSFRVVTVESATVTAISNVSIQRGAYPIAYPFAIRDRVYIWTQLMIQQPVTGAAGYPVLLRIDPTTGLPGSTTNYSFPIEMSVQDFVTSTGSGLRATDLTGLARGTEIVTSSGRWAALVPIIYRAPASTADVFVDFRLLIGRQFTIKPSQRGLTSFAADTAAFVPMGTLTRIDARGAVESGFVHAPQLATPVPGAVGSLTPLKTYYYAAHFVSRNDSGRRELSGVSLPVKITMGAGQNSNSLTIASAYLTARSNVEIELYRSLGDTQSFYLVATLAAPTDQDSVSYVDTLADTAIATQPQIYTQVGQQLSNGFPPASRFGCSGGGRIFVAGEMRLDVATASKLILGDQSPTFTDWDAFKVIAPAEITGLAWMDALTLFTEEGIYTATGDGPTDDGVGDFGTPSRLPFQIGCIEPRSVITVDEGTFFQSNRGLYLLPRGFGAPIAAGDTVMDTLAAYPIITSAVAMVKPTEQTIRWTCVTDGLDGTQRGRVIVYDLVHKSWSIDGLADRDGITDEGACTCSGNWLDGEIASGDSNPPSLIRVTDSGYADYIGAIQMLLETGDVRPFGLQERGPGARFSIMTELRSECTLNVQRFTDRGTSPISSKAFTFAADGGLGGIGYTQVDLGSAELRSLASLRIKISEQSTTEGLAFIGLSIESAQSDGLRLDKPADRIV